MLRRHLLAMQASSRDIEKDNTSIRRCLFTSRAIWNHLSLLSKFEYKYNDRLLQYAQLVIRKSTRRKVSFMNDDLDFNALNASHDFCHLLLVYWLLMFFSSLYCKQHVSRSQTSSRGAV